MTADNTVSRSLHDLGLAAWFGGSLMGAVGLNRGRGRRGGAKGAAAAGGQRRLEPLDPLYEAGEVPVESGTNPSIDTPDRARRYPDGSRGPGTP